MNILHISSVCSKDKFNKMYNIASIKPVQHSQKYYRLMIEGFARNKDINVTVLSSRFVNRKSLPHFLYKSEKECENGIEYKYLSFINLFFLRNIFLFINSFINTIIWSLRNKDGVIMWNILDIYIATGAFLATIIIPRITVSITTDVTKYPFCIMESTFSLKRKIQVLIENYIILKFDSYIFLTEYMSKVINKRNKPYVVIEGQVDIAMKSVKNEFDSKYKKKVCLYAGALKEIYGLKLLVDSFIKANIQNSELHIYGDGDYENELQEICRKHGNVKYFGVVHNNQIIKEQLKATLLLNPRPTNAEFTKYSFPSKNLEYMVSGTPLLTTDLAGIPDDHKQYIYLFQDETKEGFCNTLNYILSKPNDELHKKGMDARDFVLENKNNIIQSKKIINMINRINHKKNKNNE